jgi:hypothetical protein
MTYCWDNVDISITVKRDGVDKKDRQRCEVVVAEPLCAWYGKFGWYTILFLH